VASILIVDDEVLIAMAMAWRLEAVGHDVITASCGVEALAALDRRAADLVILDYMMPRMTGGELAAAIAARFDGSRPRVQLVTALEESRITVQPGLYDHFLHKPFREEELIAAVDSLLGRAATVRAPQMAQAADAGAAVRLATARDAAAVQAIYAPIVASTAISFELEPPDAPEVAQRITGTLETLPWLVAENGGSVLLGYAYASRHRERLAYRFAVDVSAYVAPGARRRGVARLLYRHLASILRAQGFVTAWAGIALPNAASVGLHEAMGFEPVGIYRAVGYKLGSWHDVGWWRLGLREPSAAPTEPVPLPALLLHWPGVVEQAA